MLTLDPLRHLLNQITEGGIQFIPLEIRQSGSVRLLWRTGVPGMDAFSGLAKRGRDT